MLAQTSDIHVFRMKPLQGDVFNPAFTPLLTRMKFRNSVLQRVLELLSLSRPVAGRSRGRISYRELGINQLGAVYEGLLSYTGFFVREKDGLYEVKKAGETADPLKQAYFVRAADLAQYDAKEEVVYDDQGRPKWYPQGTFIYRLAGRNRQKSASYYTPEVLTQCVVKYALKELLKDKTADQILDLTICEPALGSGAFLNEALNQLADAYLDLKRKETHRDIQHGEIEREKQKVKAWMADNRVFGVDLNPVAVELAQISLWLNTIYEGHTIPWFGAQLAVGNSLIGARRQVFTREQIVGKERALARSRSGARQARRGPSGGRRLPLAAARFRHGQLHGPRREADDRRCDEAHRSVAARVFGAFHRGRREGARTPFRRCGQALEEARRGPALYPRPHRARISDFRPGRQSRLPFARGGFHHPATE